jgi:hypothetical protein
VKALLLTTLLAKEREWKFEAYQQTAGKHYQNTQEAKKALEKGVKPASSVRRYQPKPHSCIGG